jgi:hypothetical protein
MALTLGLVAATMHAQSYPYGTYTPACSHSYLSGYGFHLQSYELKLGTTTLQSNMNSGGPAAPCYSDYTTSVSPANLIPGSQHSITVTYGTGSYTYNMGASVWIDYNNDGDFTDTTPNNERVCFTSTTAAQPGPQTMTFTPPSGFGGLRRLRVRVQYSSVPTTPSGSLSYGETEDYIVNLGFAISTQSPLPSGALGGIPYSTDIIAVNGTSPYNWQGSPTYIISGALPAGLTATPMGSPNFLRIAGTPTGTAGTANFTVSVTDGSGTNRQQAYQLTIFPQPQALPFSDDFSTDKGWARQGLWEWGVAQAYSNTGPTRSEPGTDHSSTSDNRILGHDIGADYAANISTAQYAISPPVNCQSASVVRLKFWRYMGCSPDDNCKLQVTNNGTNWTDVWASPPQGTTNDSAWTSVFYDITSVAATYPVVQVRFQVGPTNGTINNTGWCIDDLVIEEPSVDLLFQQNGSSGQQIVDNQAPAAGFTDFGTVAAGTNNTITVYMTNNGPSPVTFGGGGNPPYAKTGTDPGKFIMPDWNTVPNPLQPGASAPFTINFNSGSSTGTFTCTIEIYHNALFSGTSPFQINLTATAIIPQPIVQVNFGSATGPQISHQDPATTANGRDFGTQDINAGPTAPITIFITNSGTGTLAITTPQMGGTWWTQYQINSQGFVSQLTAGQSTSFTVRFDPDTIGQKNADVLFSHNVGSMPSPFYIPVTGNAVSSGGALLKVYEGTTSGTQIAHNDPATGGRDFGSQLVAGGATPPITITVENAGGAAMTLGVPTIAGTNASEFILTTAGFQTNLSPGGNTTFEVAFDPSSVGVKIANISFTHNDTTTTTPFIVNVRGTGVTTAAAIVVRETSATGTQLTNPAPAAGILDFGTQDVNAGPTAAATIYVENTGTASLTLGLPAFTAPTTEFQIQAAGFAGSVAPGANATFTITYDPTAPGNHTAVIEFVHNDAAAGSPFVLNVEGDAILNAPQMEVREGSTVGTIVASGDPAIGTGRDCGNVDVVAGSSLPVIVTIVNSGTQNLNIGTLTLGGNNAASFQLSTGSFNPTVAPGGNTSFDITFDPALAGIKDCTVQFTHDDPALPSPFVLNFVGTGTDPNAVLITTPNLPGAIPDATYGPMQIEAIQGTTPYVWSIYSGNLPPGLSMNSAGVVGGTPSGFGGTYNVIVRVQDQTGATNEKQYTIVVSGDLSGRGKAKDSGCAVGGETSTTPLALLAIMAAAIAGFRVVRRRS